MVKYDSSVIQTVVDQLHSKANFIVIFYGVIGLILGSFIVLGERSRCYKIKISIRDLDHLKRREQKLNLQGL